jgi:hypothetical protein
MWYRPRHRTPCARPPQSSPARPPLVPVPTVGVVFQPPAFNLKSPSPTRLRAFSLSSSLQGRRRPTPVCAGRLPLLPPDRAPAPSPPAASAARALSCRARAAGPPPVAPAPPDLSPSAPAPPDSSRPAVDFSLPPPLHLPLAVRRCRPQLPVKPPDSILLAACALLDGQLLATRTAAPLLPVLSPPPPIPWRHPRCT